MLIIVTAERESGEWRVGGFCPVGGGAPAKQEGRAPPSHLISLAADPGFSEGGPFTLRNLAFHFT